MLAIQFEILVVHAVVIDIQKYPNRAPCYRFPLSPRPLSVQSRECFNQVLFWFVLLSLY